MKKKYGPVQTGVQGGKSTAEKVLDEIKPLDPDGKFIHKNVIGREDERFQG